MTIENLISGLDAPAARVVASPMSVIDSVSGVFCVSFDEIKGNSRRREISQARQIAMYLMRQHTDLSLPKIGEVFGGKDHTTVLYSCDKIAQLVKKDLNMAQTVRELSDQISLSSRDR